MGQLSFTSQEVNKAINKVMGTQTIDSTAPYLDVSHGGTGAATAANARTNLGITPANIGVTQEGKLKIGSTVYTLQKGGTPTAGYITFIV